MRPITREYGIVINVEKDAIFKPCFFNTIHMYAEY